MYACDSSARDAARKVLLLWKMEGMAGPRAEKVSLTGDPGWREVTRDLRTLESISTGTPSRVCVGASVPSVETSVYVSIEC